MMTTGDLNSSNSIPYALQGSKLFSRRVREERERKRMKGQRWLKRG